MIHSLDPTDGYAGEFRCWIKNEILLYTTVAPTSIILRLNLILFIFTFKGLLQRSTIIYTSQTNRSNLQMIGVFCCVVSFGKT